MGKRAAGSGAALIHADHIGRPLAFTAASGLYAIAAGAHKMHAMDQLSARVSQLEALLEMATGLGFEAFSEMDDDRRESYLWCCAMLAKECRELVSCS